MMGAELDLHRAEIHMNKLLALVAVAGAYKTDDLLWQVRVSVTGLSDALELPDLFVDHGLGQEFLDAIRFLSIDRKHSLTNGEYLDQRMSVFKIANRLQALIPETVEIAA